MIKVKMKLMGVCKSIAKKVVPSNLYCKMREIYKKRNYSPIQTFQYNYLKNGELPYGVNLFCYCTNNSAGIEAELLQQALEVAGIAYQTIDLSDPDKFAKEYKQIKLFRINLIVCHAASGTPARMRLFGIDLSKHFNIGYFAWELSKIPDEFSKPLEDFQEIWTMSSFCTNTLEKRLTIPVLTVPLFVNPNNSIIENGREHFGIAKEPFLFLVAYDCKSYVERKNPDAAVQAFMKAFSPENQRVGLILKLAYADTNIESIASLLEKLAPYHNIYYINQFLSDVEMRTLIHLSDAYVTLHRGEGFGLIPIEAMSLGTPVISTEWSGNMEYMNHMNTALVGFDLVPVDGRYINVVDDHDWVWAEADVDEAAAYMRRLVDDTQWRESLIAKGLYTAVKCYNVNNVGQIIQDRLQVLKR